MALDRRTLTTAGQAKATAVALRTDARAASAEGWPTPPACMAPRKAAASTSGSPLRQRAAVSAATAPPAECPVSTRRKPGRDASCSATTGRNWRTTCQAAATKPACAWPPGNGHGSQQASMSVSCPESVPLTARTTHCEASSTATYATGWNSDARHEAATMAPAGRPAASAVAAASTSSLWARLARIPLANWLSVASALTKASAKLP